MGLELLLHSTDSSLTLKRMRLSASKQNLTIQIQKAAAYMMVDPT